MDDSFEVFVCASPNHTTMPKDKFERVLCSLHKKVRIGAPFKKLHIKKFFEDIVLEQVFQDNGDDSKTPMYNAAPSRESVYSTHHKDPTNSLLGPLQQHHKEQIIVLNLKKQKLTLAHFPSTNKMYDMVCETRHIFKINNRTYVNFIESQYKSDATPIIYYSIMINYEHESNSDSQLHIEMIEKVIKTISSALSGSTC